MRILAFIFFILIMTAAKLTFPTIIDFIGPGAVLLMLAIFIPWGFWYEMRHRNDVTD